MTPEQAVALVEQLSPEQIAIVQSLISSFTSTRIDSSAAEFPRVLDTPTLPKQRAFGVADAVSLQVTIDEAAALLNYSRRTVERLIEKGVLSTTGKRKMRRIPRTELDRFVKHAADLDNGESVWHLARSDRPATARGAKAQSTKTKATSGATPHQPLMENGKPAFVQLVGRIPKRRNVKG